MSKHWIHCGSLLLFSAAAIFSLPSSAAAPPLPAPIRLPAEEFPLSAVKLLDSPFQKAMEVDKAFLLRVNPDRLLAGFRSEAGLPKKADPYQGGWESITPGQSFTMAGHSLGHYLTALCLMSENDSTGEFRRRANYIVSELADCQKAAGIGMLAAFPNAKSFFENLAAGQMRQHTLNRLNDGYVPFYSIHKVMAGLRDAWLILDNQTARDVLIHQTDWLADVFQNLSDDQIQLVLQTEQGGLMEVVADVAVITGDTKYLTLAQRLNHRAFFDPLVRGEDRLDKQHGNANIAKVIGMERLYELTGQKDFDRAARFFWEDVVHTRSVVIGGNTTGEFFFPVADFVKTGLLSPEGPETCNTYNMIRLSQRLWLAEPSAPVVDFIERALYNHILSSQDPDHGGFCYFTPMRPGHYRVYCNDSDFWCCTGTGMENHTKYGEFIYAHSADKLWVNLLIPSKLTWADKGVSVKLETHFPEDGLATLTFTAAPPQKLALAIRYPGWVADGAMKLSVNNTPQKISAHPDSYAVIEREWKTGDTLTIEWPPTIHTEMLPTSQEWVSVLWGPVVLAGRLGRAGIENVNFNRGRNLSAGNPLPVSTVPIFTGSAADIPAKLKPVPGQPMTFHTEGLARPTEVTLAPFYQVHHERYAIYWDLAEVAK